MNELLANRYVQLGLLTLGIGTAFWVIIWLVLMVLALDGFPAALHFAVSYLAAGVIVSKFFSNRIF